MAAAVTTAARGLFPALTADEQRIVAARILFDWRTMTQGKAGATLTVTDSSGATITARSKPLDVIAYRMRQYRAIPLLWGLFLRRHSDGKADVWRKLIDHFRATFPQDALEVFGDAG